MELSFNTAVSGTAIITAAISLFRVSHYLGRFQEFKESMERRENDFHREEDTFVRRVEWDQIARHLDQRFDSLEKQIGDIRQEVLRSRIA